MKVLVTGARGFLGRRVIDALHRRGHPLRALDLPGSRRDPDGMVAGVEEVDADLCTSSELPAACDGVQAVVHLAAMLQGSDASLEQTAVDGTERLLDAMEQAGVPRMVLVSSLSVYDWSTAAEVLDEDSPLEPRPERRDGYTRAKLKQERLVRARCARSGLALTVLRPGVLWGPGREYPSIIGQRVGRFHLLVGAARQLPLVHVDNCADAIAVALDAGAPQGIFNVIDDAGITARRFVGDHLRRSGRFGIAIPAAYRPCLAMARLLHRMTPSAFRGTLPSFVAPAQFAARYRPVSIDDARFRSAMGWAPPLDYAQCLERTYCAAPSR